MPLPIIIDTDIGDDIDDALALSVALRSPELVLRGITTVFRDAPRRTLLAHQLLERLGQSRVPVAAGVSRPLLHPWSAIPGGEQVGRQFEALGASLTPPQAEHAIPFLRRHILETHAQGEPLTVVGIGPMTNLGLLFSLHPELAALCRLRLMAGDFLSPQPIAEWNVACDPEAAAMTLRAFTEAGADIAFVGLDVTLQCVLDGAQERLFRDAPLPHAQFLAQLIDLWNHTITLHDPLTVLTLLDDCVSFEARRVEIALCGQERGRTLVVDGPPNCRIATQVDAPRAKALFLERVLG